jgi:hypothetical protein
LPRQIPVAACLLLTIACPGILSRSRPSDEPALSLGRAQLCVTEGSVEGIPGERLSVNVPKMRAYATVPTPQDVTAHFTYLGATAEEARLGSGELRRQFGLKLRAQDACNLVYVMWRIDPKSQLVVSVKSNPRQHSSAECGNRGYRNVKARRSSPVPLLRSGDRHTLHAEMNGDEMSVFVDGNSMWEGPVGSEVLSFSGPVGIRSDNARLEIELQSSRSGQVESKMRLACRAGESE